MSPGMKMKITKIITRVSAPCAVITAFHERRIDKIAEAVHIMERSITLTIKQIESDHRYVAIRTFRLVRKKTLHHYFRLKRT